MKNQATLMSSAKTSGTDVWATPEGLLDRVRSFCDGQIPLDPCDTNPSSTGAYITMTGDPHNGLEVDWTKVLSENFESRNRVAFVNPPYSDIKNWVRKCIAEAEKGTQVILLCAGRPDTAWVQDYAAPTSDVVCFIKGRLKFKDAPSSAPFPSFLFYWGDRTNCFRKHFDLGWTITHLSKTKAWIY